MIREGTRAKSLCTVTDSTLGRVLDVDSVVHRRALSFNLSDLLPSMPRQGMPDVTPEFWWPEDRAWPYRGSGSSVCTEYLRHQQV